MCGVFGWVWIWEPVVCLVWCVCVSEEDLDHPEITH